MKPLLLVLTLALLAGAAAAGPIAYSVNSDGDDRLYRIDLETGAATAVGAVGFDDVEALAFQPGTGVLFGYDDIQDVLLTIDLATGAGTLVGHSGVNVTDMGIAFDGEGRLYMVDDLPGRLYEIDPATGLAVEVGALGQRVTGLTARGGTLFGLGGDGTNDLGTVDPGTGAFTIVGALGGVSLSDGGIDFDRSGRLWGIEDGGDVFRVDPTTGLATVVATTRAGFESLAIVSNPEPGTAALLMLGVAGLVVAVRRRRS